MTMKPHTAPVLPNGSTHRKTAEDPIQINTILILTLPINAWITRLHLLRLKVMAGVAAVIYFYQHPSQHLIERENNCFSRLTLVNGNAVISFLSTFRKYLKSLQINNEKQARVPDGFLTLHCWMIEFLMVLTDLGSV